MKKKVISIIVILAILIGGFTIIMLFKNNNKNESNNLVEMNTKTFKEKINNKDSFILLITKEGCSHCAEYLPVFINVLEKYKNSQYEIEEKILNKKEEISDLESDKEYLADIANISGTPTTVFIENGEETTVLNRIVGSASRKTVIDRLKTMKYIK